MLNATGKVLTKWTFKWTFTTGMTYGIRSVCPPNMWHSECDCRQCHWYCFIATFYSSFFFFFSVLNQGRVLKKKHSEMDEALFRILNFIKSIIPQRNQRENCFKTIKVTDSLIFTFEHISSLKEFEMKNGKIWN